MFAKKASTVLTIILNRLFLILLPRPNSRNAFLKPYSFLLFLSLLCAPLQSYAEPFAEYYLLKKYKNFIQKNKNGYLLKDQSGVGFQLKNCPQISCGSESDYFISFIDVINDRYLLFNVGGDETNYFEIYDLNHEKILTTYHFPEFSPDLTRIAAVGGDELNGSSINIYELRGNKFENVFESGMGEFHVPKFYSWNGNDQFRVTKDDEYEKVTGDDTNKNMVDLVFSFDKNSEKWSYKKATNSLPLKAARDFKNKFPDIMNSFSDKKTVLSILKERGANTKKYLDKKFFDDEEVMIAAIKSDESSAAYLSPRLKDDLNFMNLALEQSRSAFQFASERLRGDRNFTIKAVGKGSDFSYASDELRDDEEFLKIVIAHKDGFSAEHDFLNASQRIKDKATSNLEFAKSLLASNCYVFTHFSEKLRDNKDVFWTAINDKRCAGPIIFYSASKSLKDNISLVKELVMRNPESAIPYIAHASDSIQHNKKFLLMLAKDGAIISDSFVKEIFKNDPEFIKEMTRLYAINSKKVTPK